MVASPKSRPWWVLWVRVCSWFVLASKVLQLCTNHLMFGFVQAHVSNWCLSLFLFPPGAPARLSTPKCYEPGSLSPTPYFSDVFSLDSHLSPLRSLGARQGESYKGLGDKSYMICGIICFKGFWSKWPPNGGLFNGCLPGSPLDDILQILDDKKPKVFPSINC